MRLPADTWTAETVRAELDAIAALHGVGSFRSRYLLSAAEMFVLVSEHLSAAERALCRAVLIPSVRGADTGMIHGPAESSSYNGHPRASFRVERRATDMRDIGTLRMLARDADSVGATQVAEHCRTLAGIFAGSAAIEAFCFLASESALTAETNPTGFVGPAVGLAYHTPTDVFVEVVARDGYALVFRSPYGFTDKCSPAFLFDSFNAEPYVYGA